VECACLAGFELVGGDDDATKNNCADILECAASRLRPLRCAPCAIGRVRLIVHDTVRPPRCGLSRGRARCGDPATPEESPCQNGAACEEGRLDYTCACAAGFDGDDCENDVNECASRPCLHEGACYEGDAPPHSGRRLAAWDSPIASTPAPEPSAGRRLQDGDTGDCSMEDFAATSDGDLSATCLACMQTVSDDRELFATCYVWPATAPDSFGCACVAGWAGDVCEVPTSQRNLD
jgi:Notch-like protein